jgi:hypothetical protein
MNGSCLFSTKAFKLHLNSLLNIFLRNGYHVILTVKDARENLTAEMSQAKHPRTSVFI